MAKKILLIDDDRIVGRSLQRLLELKGYNVSFVDNGAAAIEKVKEINVDLIISDIRMAELDGIETIKRIRKFLKEQSKDLAPELLITGYAENETYQKAEALNVADILYKPFDNDKFLQRVADILAAPAIQAEKQLEPPGEASLPSIEKFFGFPLPEYLKKACKNTYVFEKLDQKRLMEIIDFSPPFLRADKMVVFGPDRKNILQNRSIVTGILTIEDVKGHYNDTIFLAMYGLLMASAASIYLAALFPSTAPQVVEVDHIKPSRDRVLWRPAISGSRFFVETGIIKKKLHMVIADTRLISGEVFMGEVSRLKLILAPKDHIWKAKSLPECSLRLGGRNSGILEETFQKTSAEESEEFFGMALSEDVKKNYINKQIYRKLNRQEITKIIDFTPPFLKIDKMIIFDAGNDSVLQSSSLAVGTITLKDIEGHYNDTVFLAMCGLLMSSAASVYLAPLFPGTAPEVIEAKGVRPIEKEIWKPADNGSTFWLETSIIKKKLRVVIVRAKIYLDSIPYGMVDELKLLLIPRQLIWKAPELTHKGL